MHSTISLPFDVEFRRLVDSEILRDNTGELGSQCLETLIQIAQNVLDHPKEPKYRAIKERNGKLKSTVLSVKGGPEALVAMGMLKQVKEFEACWVVPDTDHVKQRLRIAVDVMREYRDKAAERKARELKAKIAAATEEQSRREKVRLLIEEDRQERQLRAKLRRH